MLPFIANLQQYLGFRRKRTKNNAPLVNSQTVEENERLRPRIPWK